MNRRLFRSSRERMIAGVCGGLAEYFDMDPSLMRVLWLVVGFLTGIFPAIVLYIVLAVVVPPEPWGVPGHGVSPPPPPQWPGGWSSGAGAWTAAGGAAAGAPEGTGGAPPEGTAPEGTAPEGAPPASGAEAVPGGAATQGGGPPGIGAPPWAGQWPDWRAERHAMREAWRAERRGYRRGTGGIVFGLLLIVIGGALLLPLAFPEIDASRVWPIVLVGVGVVLLAASLLGRREGPS